MYSQSLGCIAYDPVGARLFTAYPNYDSYTYPYLVSETTFSILGAYYYYYTGYANSITKMDCDIDQVRKLAYVVETRNSG